MSSPSRQHRAIRGILTPKNDVSKFIPLDCHTVIDVHEIDPYDLTVNRVDSHIVKIDKRTGKVKRHMNHNTVHCK